MPTLMQAADSRVTAWPGWQHDTALVKVYTKKIKAAFREAVDEASDKITDWWDGRLTTTRSGLLHTIGGIIEKAIKKTLFELWTQAYFLGDRSAEAVAAHTAPRFGLWVPGHPETAEISDIAGHITHLLNGYGISLVQSIASTRLEALGEEISDAVSRGEKPEDLIKRLPKILLTDMRSSSIANTETMRGISTAALARYRRMGATHKAWEPAPGGSCPLCQRNHQDGVIPLDSVFTSGDIAPPCHPGDRCAIRGFIPDFSGKAEASAPPPPQPQPRRQRRRRRRAGITGEVLPEAASQVYGSEPGAGFDANNVQQPPNPSGPGWGGGGNTFHPHDVTGTQREDIPGASAGMEPPHWQWWDYGPAGPGGAFNNGDLNRVPDTDLWPQGGQGTEQLPGGLEGDSFHEGRNPYYPSGNGGERQDTDLDDLSEPDEDEEDAVPDAEDSARYPSRRGRAPNAVGKSKKDKPWKDTSIPIADRIYQQLAEGYPPRAITWVRSKAVRWDEPAEIPLKDIDFSNEDSWTASKDHNKVQEHREKLEEKIEDGKHGKPVVVVKSPGNSLCVVIDGHGRSLAYRQLKEPIWAYCGHVTKNEGEWLHTHHQQDHDAAASKSLKPVQEPVAAGIVIRAADTGRILLLQRALTSTHVTDKAESQESASNQSLTNPVASEHVYNLMLQNFRPKGIKWVKDATWFGPVSVSLGDIDFTDEAHWAAHHQESHVRQLMPNLKSGDYNPVILVRVKGENRFRAADGHHRVRAAQQLHMRSIRAYVAEPPSGDSRWQHTYDFQIHGGDSPLNR